MSLPDCRDCYRSSFSYGTLRCTRGSLPVKVEYMRDEHGDCGREGRLFERKPRVVCSELAEDEE